MTGRDTVYGVFFYTDEDQIDVEEVKKNFGKYGEIAFVKQLQKKVFVNFKTKEEAENCLSDSPDPNYGKLGRGKFRSDKAEKKVNSSRESESDEASVKSNSRMLMDADLYYRESHMIPNSHLVPRSHTSERKSMPEFKHRNSNGPPPLQSVDNGPPPLLSIDRGPPPLISALEKNHPLSVSSSVKRPSKRPPLLPIPPHYLHHHFNPQLKNSHQNSNPSVQDASVGPPPLVSAISQPVKGRLESTRSCLSHEDYVKKYENYILIINIPEDITTEEIEKILYPHIPVCISEPEVTSIKMRILFCLVTFNTKTEATKAAKQLDGVEIRGQCLNMIRLDELVLFSDVSF